MRTKRIFGFIFIAIAFIFTLSILAGPSPLEAVYGFFRIFTDHLDNYHIGYAIGTLLFEIFFIFITIRLWIIGIRWAKQKNNN